VAGDGGRSSSAAAAAAAATGDAGGALIRGGSAGTSVDADAAASFRLAESKRKKNSVMRSVPIHPRRQKII